MTQFRTFFFRKGPLPFLGLPNAHSFELLVCPCSGNLVLFVDLHVVQKADYLSVA